MLLGLSQYITSRVVIILASATYSTEINQLLCPHKKKLVQRTSRFWKGRHRSGLWLGRFDGTGGVGELLQIGTMNFENRLDIYILQIVNMYLYIVKYIVISHIYIV